MTQDQEDELKKLVTDYMDACQDLEIAKQQQEEARRRQVECHNVLAVGMQRSLGRFKAFVYGGHVFSLRDGTSHTWVAVEEIAKVEP